MKSCGGSLCVAHNSEVSTIAITFQQHGYQHVELVELHLLIYSL